MPPPTLACPNCPLVDRRWSIPAVALRCSGHQHGACVGVGVDNRTVQAPCGVVPSRKVERSACRHAHPRAARRRDALGCSAWASTRHRACRSRPLGRAHHLAAGKACAQLNLASRRCNINVKSRSMTGTHDEIESSQRIDAGKQAIAAPIAICTSMYCQRMPSALTVARLA